MKKILLIFANDLRRRIKSPLAILMMMCIPLVLTLLIGSVFGRSGRGGLPRIRVLFVDEDKGFMSRFILQGLQEDRFAELLDLVTVDSVEGEKQMGKGKASAMIVIPERFTSRILNKKPVEIRVVENPSESFLPVIVEEIVATMAVIIDNGRNIFDEPIENAIAMLEGEEWPSMGDLKVLMDEAKTGILLTRGYIADSLVTFRTETAASEEEDGDEAGGLNVFSYIMSGSLMLGLLFTSNIMLRDIVREKESGTLARILTAPVGAGHVVAGKVMAAYAVTMIACLLLLLIGKVGFRMDLGDPLVLGVHLIVTMFMITGIMTFSFGLIRSGRAADAIMSVVIIIMSLFGGSMVSIEQLGEPMKTIGRFSPVYWANDGFKKIFLAGAGFDDISMNIIILVGLGVITLIPGAILLGKRFGKG